MIKRILSKTKIFSIDKRTPERIKKHYELEKSLAVLLKEAEAKDRSDLYVRVYEELFREITDHPQFTKKQNKEINKRAVYSKLNLLKPFLTKKTIFLELGAGDCSLSFEVSKRVKKVIAIDVSKQITRSKDQPENFKLIISDVSRLNMPAKTIDLVYCNQLLEHLHPEDALAAISSVYKVLSDGGRFMIITPHRLSGPHDVSKYFDEAAKGFHLKEYTYTELRDILASAGFSRTSAVIGTAKIYVNIPTSLLILLERVLEKLPKRVERAISHTLAVQLILGIKLIAKK